MSPWLLLSLGLLGALTAVGCWRLQRVLAALPVIPHGEGAVLITGGRAGIGRACAEHLAKKGWTVLVSVRKQADAEAIEQESPSLVPVVFDVTVEEHGPPALERVESILREKSLKLAAVVANAGINPEGDALQEETEEEEETTEEEATEETEDQEGQRAARRAPRPNELRPLAEAEVVFATNVLGVARTVQLFLPRVREAGGRLVIVGSYFGSISGALGLGHLYYESTKFALEGFADGLRRSLRKEAVSVSLVKPGNIVTNMNDYGEDSPAVVSEAIEDAISSSRPRPRYYAGRVKGIPVWLLCRVFSLLPESLTDCLL